MVTKKDIESVIKAKQNEIKSKQLDDYYGETKDVIARMTIKDAYKRSDDYSLEKLAHYLEATRVPKYVRLAKFLREIYYKNNIELEKTLVLLKNEENKYGLKYKEQKTTFKEFKQIEKRSKKMSAKAARKLNKYKDVKTFVKKHYRHVLSRLMEEKISDYDIESLTNFFDNCQELKFLNQSKLTKRVR